MPFNGSGGFDPLTPPTYPAVSGEVIFASKFNSVINDILSGLGACVTRNGQSPATANLPMGGFKHTGAGDATASGQYVVYGQTGAVSLGGALTVTGTITGNLTGNVTGNVTGALTGNASTATALQTPRNINGVAFDGTAPITVTAAAGTLTGATLAAGVTASSLTSFGAGIALGTPASGNLANCTFPTLNQSTSGNAATATALQTARLINGTSFNGTSDITVTAAAGTLTGGTLAAGVTASSLASVAAGCTVGGIEIGLRRLVAGSVTTGSIGAADSGKAIYATGGITVPNSTFQQGDVVTIYNNTASGITITNSLSTAWLLGVSFGASRTLGARQHCVALFISSTEAEFTGALT